MRKEFTLFPIFRLFFVSAQVISMKIGDNRIHRKNTGSAIIRAVSTLLIYSFILSSSDTYKYTCILLHFFTSITLIWGYLVLMFAFSQEKERVWGGKNSQIRSHISLMFACMTSKCLRKYVVGLIFHRFWKYLSWLWKCERFYVSPTFTAMEWETIVLFDFMNLVALFGI